jgi:hypothetical protein
MKNSIRTSIMVASVLALASMGAYAANSSTTTIGITATVSSFDNIACTQTTVDLNGGVGITASGPTAAQAVNCTVTSNDVAAMDVTAYLPHLTPLTGSGSSSNKLANTLIGWNADGSSTFAQFAALSGTLSADDGAIVATSVTLGDSVGVDFYLNLSVPVNTKADSYSATLTVAITPHAV